MRTIEFKIEGMSCGRCIEHVREAIASVAGARPEDIRIGSARVALSPEMSPGPVLDAIRNAGYDPALQENSR